MDVEDLLGVEGLLAVLALLAQAPAAVVLFLVDLEAGLTDEALVALLAMVGLKNV